jgi:hypothetical protein
LYVIAVVTSILIVYTSIGGTIYGYHILQALIGLSVFGGAVAVLALISSITKIFKMSLSLSHSQSSNFKDLKRQFRLTLEFLSVVLVVLGIEVFAMMDFSKSDQSYDFLIVLDVIKCFSAALIFSLVMDNKTNDGKFVV